MQKKKTETVPEVVIQTVSKYLTITLADGSKKQLRFRGKTEKEAQAKLDKAKLEYENGLLVVNSKTTFQHYAAKWLETYKKNHTEADSAEVERRIDQHLTPFIGGMAMAQIRLMHLENCLLNMTGKSSSNYKKTYHIIRRIFSHAHNNEVIPRDPSAMLQIPKGEDGCRRAFTDAEKEAFFKTLSKHKFGLFFAIMYGCGHRPGEVRAHTIFDIDAKNRMFSVTQAIKNNSKTPGSPKTKAGVRITPIPDWLWEMLEPLLEERKHDKCPYLFHGADNKPISKQRLKRAWQSFLRLMDIEGGAKTHRHKVTHHSPVIGWDELTPYYIRHTYCTEMEEMGLSDKLKKFFMGHASTDVTNGVYTHITPAMLENAQRVINAYYDKNYPGKLNQTDTKPTKMRLKRHVADIIPIKANY